MKQNMLPLAATAPVVSTVTVLQFKGHLRLDPDPLASIYATHGEDAAEDTVCRTLADLANRITDLQAIQQRSAFADMPLPARRISAIAGQIGLTDVAAAATHVGIAAGQRDGIAIEATMSRLERCFDFAMTEVWQFQSIV